MESKYRNVNYVIDNVLILMLFLCICFIFHLISISVEKYFCFDSYICCVIKINLKVISSVFTKSWGTVSRVFSSDHLVSPTPVISLLLNETRNRKKTCLKFYIVSFHLVFIALTECVYFRVFRSSSATKLLLLNTLN